MCDSAGRLASQLKTFKSPLTFHSCFHQGSVSIFALGVLGGYRADHGVKIFSL